MLRLKFDMSADKTFFPIKPKVSDSGILMHIIAGINAIKDFELQHKNYLMPYCKSF
ncbi:MAG: hypothetical protein HY752_08985 [Nitrospirae bacterium]|nr:hypothetical protein [Nitrospirota bacterium]